jgi:MFS family permease
LQANKFEVEAHHDKQYVPRSGATSYGINFIPISYGINFIPSFIKIGQYTEYGSFCMYVILDSKLMFKCVYSHFNHTVPHCRSAVEIMLSRVVAGFGVGVVFAVCPIYVGEIAEDNVRGILGRTTILSCDNVFLDGYTILITLNSLFLIHFQPNSHKFAIVKSSFSYLSFKLYVR